MLEIVDQRLDLIDQNQTGVVAESNLDQRCVFQVDFNQVSQTSTNAIPGSEIGGLRSLENVPLS